jgi:hypothetical protein
MLYASGGSIKVLFPLRPRCQHFPFSSVRASCPGVWFFAKTVCGLELDGAGAALAASSTASCFR